jgi:hypothetical protein
MFHHSSFSHTHRILVGFRMHLKISLKITHLAYCSLSLLFFMYLLVFGIAWLTILYEKTSVMSNIHKKMKLWELEVVQPWLFIQKKWIIDSMVFITPLLFPKPQFGTGESGQSRIIDSCSQPFLSSCFLGGGKEVVNYEFIQLSCTRPSIPNHQHNTK